MEPESARPDVEQSRTALAPVALICATTLRYGGIVPNFSPSGTSAFRDVGRGLQIVVLAMLAAALAPNAQAASTRGDAVSAWRVEARGSGGSHRSCTMTSPWREDGEFFAVVAADEGVHARVSSPKWHLPSGSLHPIQWTVEGENAHVDQATALPDNVTVDFDLMTDPDAMAHIGRGEKIFLSSPDFRAEFDLAGFGTGVSALLDCIEERPGRN